jgi:hypothetical protein
MIERSVERRALPREVINLPAMLSFDGISGLHPCVVRDINTFGACLSTTYYIFARDFDLSLSGFHRTLACRVVCYPFRRRVRSAPARTETRECKAELASTSQGVPLF